MVAGLLLRGLVGAHGLLVQGVEVRFDDMEEEGRTHGLAAEGELSHYFALEEEAADLQRTALEVREVEL